MCDTLGDEEDEEEDLEEEEEIYMRVFKRKRELTYELPAPSRSCHQCSCPSLLSLVISLWCGETWGGPTTS